jgi:dihydrofolate reductase
MRKIVAYELLSLDGVAEQPDGFVTEFDEVMSENLGRVIATQDAVILGRRTYDEWARFWPTSNIEPFASFINGVEKFVLTSAPLEEPWNRSSPIDGGLSHFIGELKTRPGGDIGVHGSIDVAQQLLAEGLIDELRLVIAPAIHRRGRRLFDRGLPRRLVQTRTVTSPTGYLLVDYAISTPLA